MFDLQSRFGPDELVAAMVLTNQPHTPTPNELDAALILLFPDDNAPTVADLLAEGILVYTLDKKRVRMPTALVGEAWQGFNLEGFLIAEPSAAFLTKGGVCPISNESADKSTTTVVDSDRLFSYFTGSIYNTIPHASIMVQQLHAMIINPPPSLHERTSKVLAEYETNGKTVLYTELKCKLDYFTIGGVFTRRRDDALVTASDLLVLDFDQLNEQVAEARTALLADALLAPAIVLLFTSPSGAGLKVIMGIDPRYSRSDNYFYISKYLIKHYGWAITYDSKTAEVSRACFLSYDPSAWLSPAYAAASDLNTSQPPLLDS